NSYRMSVFEHFPNTTLIRSMVGIDALAIARDLSENRRAALARVFHALQHQHRRALAEDEAVAIFVERPAQAGGHGLQRVEAGERSEEHTSELQSLRQLVCRL